MQELLEKLRSKRSEYYQESSALSKKLVVEMDEKLFDNVDVYGLKGEDEEGNLVETSLLDVIDALKSKVNVLKPMVEDLKNLNKQLSMLETKIRIGVDDRNQAKKALVEKTSVIFNKKVNEINELVNFDNLRIVIFKTNKMTSKEELKLVEVMVSEGFALIEQHEGYHYKFIGYLNDKGKFKSLSHVVFSKIEGKVTEDRNFISNISTKTVDVKGFLEHSYHF